MGRISDVEIAMIGAQSHNWPAPDTSLQWQALHEVVAIARTTTRQADTAIVEVETDRDLSLEGKRRRVAEVAKTAIKALEQDTHLTKAEEAVNRWLQKIDEKMQEPLAGMNDAVLASEIRAYIAAHDNPQSFLEKHKTDPCLTHAVRGAPAFLSGLTEGAKESFLQSACFAMSPKEMEQMAQLSRALATAGQSIGQAARKLAERGQLVKGGEPKAPKA